MSYDDIIEDQLNDQLKDQKIETREIITDLLNDGSLPDALYTIEHHFSANSFAELEDLAVEVFKLGYDVQDAEELDLDDGSKVICFDALIESALDPEQIDEQVGKLIELAHKHKIDYDGWGTYFESDEDEDEDDDEEEHPPETLK